MANKSGMPAVDDSRTQTGYKLYDGREELEVRETKWIETPSYLTFFTPSGVAIRQKKHPALLKEIGKTKLEAVQKWLEHTGYRRLKIAEDNLSTIRSKVDSAEALLKILEQEEKA